MWCTQPPRQQTQAADKFTLKLINRYEIVCASCKHIGRHTGSACTRHNTLTLTLDVMLSAVSSRSHVNSIQRTVSPSNYFIFSSVHLVCVFVLNFVCVCVSLVPDSRTHSPGSNISITYACVVYNVRPYAVRNCCELHRRKPAIPCNVSFVWNCICVRSLPNKYLWK